MAKRRSTLRDTIKKLRATVRRLSKELRLPRREWRKAREDAERIARLEAQVATQEQRADLYRQACEAVFEITHAKRQQITGVKRRKRTK